MLVTALLLAAFQSPSPPDPGAVSTERLAAGLRDLCRQPRLAGSPEAGWAAELAARTFEQAGLRVERARYRVHLPRQTGQSLVMVGRDGEREELELWESGYGADPDSRRGQVPPMHGLTGQGRVRGRVVFAGRGTAEEFAALRARGVELDGTVALVRYGGLYRGLKVDNAGRAGCIGALLYTDDEDDGSAKGDPLPDGPWRPHDGIQRGSVFNGDGDPLTQGWAALPEAERASWDEAVGLVTIPSLPIAMGNARRLFGDAGRPEETGLLDVEVELFVEQDRRPVEIENVLGWIEGATRPDEWIIAGAHRDAWGLGAVDNGTGTNVVLEAARVLGTALASGWRPDRTLVLATWDAEEWGLVGSTEWVEQHRAELLAKGVAYLNLDVVASGPHFGATCTPGMVDALTRACSAESVEVPGRLGIPGGGSDHVPFLELAGVEVLSFGFHGGNGTYHSAYDTPYVVEKFLDPGFRHHQRACSLLLRMLTDLGHADTRVDGLDGWSVQLLQAGSKLPLEEELGKRFQDAAQELRDAATRASDYESPHRFLRFFLPDGSVRAERSTLWRSAGYASQWFPEIAEALARGDDPTAATLAAEKRLLRAAASLAEHAAAVGR